MPLTILESYKCQRELNVHRIALSTLVAIATDVTLAATLDALEHGDRVDRDAAKLIREIDRQLVIETEPWLGDVS